MHLQAKTKGKTNKTQLAQRLKLGHESSKWKLKVVTQIVGCNLNKMKIKRNVKSKNTKPHSSRSLINAHCFMLP
jgi:hypothetical protein